MKSRYPYPLLPALAAVTLAACSTEYIPGNTLKVRGAELDLASLRGPITVESVDGSRSQAQYFSIVGDSAMWVEPTTSNVRSVPLPKLRSFVVHDHLISSTVGSIVGAGVGTTVAASQSSEMSAQGVGIMVGGEVLGLLVGSLFSCDQTYTVIDPATIPLPDTTRNRE